MARALLHQGLSSGQNLLRSLGLIGGGQHVGGGQVDAQGIVYAVYALFQRCGIISEIHDCTIAAFGYLFVEEGIVDSSLYDEILASKDCRIDAQYYVLEEQDEDPSAEAEKAGAFVLAVEELIDRLGENMIGKARSRLENV